MEASARKTIFNRKNEPAEQKRMRIERTRREAKESKQFWKVHVFAQVDSGLKRSEYCNEHSLSVNTFKRWRARFVGELKARAQHKRLDLPNPFVDVSAPSVPESNIVEEKLELILPGGTTIVVTERTSMQLLARVLKVTQQEGTC